MGVARRIRIQAVPGSGAAMLRHARGLEGIRMRLNLDGVRTRCVSFISMALVALAMPVEAAETAPAPVARPSPEWLRDAVVYEVFPRAFSEKGNFAGVTGQL